MIPHSGLELSGDFTSYWRLSWRPIRGTTWSGSRHGSASWTALAALTGVCSERATPNLEPPVKAKTVKVPQIQFQFLDMVVVGVGWGAAALSRWCCLCQGAACQSWRLLEEFPHSRRVAARAVRTWKVGLLYLCPRIFLSLFWCMGVACGVRRIFGTRALLVSTVGTFSTGGFGRISTFSTFR